MSVVDFVNYKLISNQSLARRVNICSVGVNSAVLLHDVPAASTEHFALGD